MNENDDNIGELKRLKIDPNPESEVRSEVTGDEPKLQPTNSLLAEIENVPVVNLDSSIESTGSREESKAANNDKELYIDADNSEQQHLLAKEKYVRLYPEHEQPAIQELLAKMNETDVRIFKFINDSGLYSDESILGMLDLEKRAIKQNKKNKNGKMKLTKISEDERAKLEPEDIVFARWIVQDKDKDAMFYPAIIGEKVKLYLDETDLIERKLREWNLFEEKNLTETLIKQISDLDSMIDLTDEIEYKAKRLAADGARLNANGTSIVNAAQQEIVDPGSICKKHLGIHNRALADKIQCLSSKESLLEFIESAMSEQPEKTANGIDSFAGFI